MKNVETGIRMNNFKRKPTSPGEILSEEFLKPLGMTQTQLANHIGYDVKTINRLVNEHTSVDAEMAIKLGATFKTTPDFWLNLQTALDLFHALKRVKKVPKPVSGNTSGNTPPVPMAAKSA